jgi:hypothetical protein
MCHFITATLPQTIERKSVRAIFKSHGLAFKVITNPHVQAQIDPEDLYILTTTGNCDCGTILGSLSRGGEAGTGNYKTQIKKLRKQGWSEAKIQRWVSEKEQLQEKQERENAILAAQGEAEASRWLDFIRVLLTSGLTPRVGLLLHTYQGGIESERLEISQTAELQLAYLTPEFLMSIEEDVLYEFVF